MTTKEVRQKITDAFGGVRFVDAGHTYIYGGTTLGSVTTDISNHKEEFKTQVIARKKAAKHNKYRKPGQPYKTPQDFIKEWKYERDKSVRKGKNAHKIAEDYPNHRNPVSDEEIGVVGFMDQLESHLKVVGKEILVFNSNVGIAGQIDLVLFNENTEQIIIVDWKTNKDIFKNFKGKTMYHPFSHMLDMPMSHYILQLNYYKLFLELGTGIPVESMQIVWLTDKPDISKTARHSGKYYHVYEANDMQGLLRMHLNI